VGGAPGGLSRKDATMTLEFTKDALERSRETRSRSHSPQKLVDSCPELAESTRGASVIERLKEMPVSHRLGYLRAVRGKAAPRAAIRAFCLECVGWDRHEVGMCTATACPLYKYRPYQ